MAAAAAARPTGRVECLQHILVQDAMISQTLADWIMTADEGPKIESVNEYAKWWNTSDLDKGLTTDLVEYQKNAAGEKMNAESNEGRRLLIRLSSAWDLCVADWKEDSAARAKPVVPEKELDEDSAWPEDRQLQCENAIKRCYSLTLPPYSIPNTMIMHMMNRNWKKKSAELCQLATMKHGLNILCC